MSVTARLAFHFSAGWNLPTSRSRSRWLACSASSDDGKAISDEQSTKSKSATSGLLVANVKLHDQFIGKVCDVGPAKSSWIDIGVITATGKPVRARLRHYTLGSKAASTVEGAILPVYVHKIQPDSARIEVRKGVPPTPPLTLESEGVRLLSSLVVGEKLSGTIVGLGDYGAVVDVKVLRDGKKGGKVPITGLLMRRLFRENWASEADIVKSIDAERTLRVGETIDVWVRTVHIGNGALFLDSVAVDPEKVQQEAKDRRRSIRNRARRDPVSVLKDGEKRDGFVRSVEKFGVFVDIGVRRNGLIHYSEMSDRHKSDWRETVVVGVRVHVEVLGVEDGRVSLRLLSLPDEEAFEILERANSPMARVEDVEKAKALTLRNRNTSTRKGSTSMTSVGNAPNEANANLQDDWQGTTDNQRGEEEEDETREPEKFSDEYFENKYGF